MYTSNREVAKPAGLEEEVEFSSVTNLRESLLSRVDDFGTNPAKRYVITKHGQPQAVLMSYQTYSLMKKLTDQMLARLEAASKSDPVGAAFSRLRSDHGEDSVKVEVYGVGAVSATVSATLQNIRAQFEQLDAVLGQNATQRK
jgi:PHD/YefM family antitoxin component YafN of YafNO toxin-antitoxin module